MGDAVTTEQVLDWIIHHIVQILLGLSVVIQITPIKINPWSALFTWIGKKINTESNTKIDQLIKSTGDLEAKIIEIDQKVDENEKDRIRWEILDFANSYHNGRPYVKDEFQHIATLGDKYEKLLERTHDKNGVFQEEYNFIKRVKEAHDDAERLEKERQQIQEQH